MRTVAQICRDTNTPFKFTLDRHFVMITLSKIWSREASGKFITIYPRDENHFREIIEMFYTALRSFTGPYILSDRRYKDSQVVYYRYGGISGFHVLTYTGDQAFMLEAPDGEIVPDMRSPYWNPPAWVKDPFGQTDDEGDVGELTLKNGRYRIDRVITFSVSGGVYLATDLHSNSQVLIKEARPATNIDEHDIDAVERLRKEYRLLQSLQETSIAPRPVELLQDWEHLFLVEEYIRGIDLGRFMTTYNPLTRVFPDQAAKDAHVAVLRKIWTKLAQGLLIMHNNGIVFGDFSIKNVIVSDLERGEVRFVDFEGAWEEGMDKPPGITTPGYSSPTAKTAPEKNDDIYGLGAVMLGSLFVINSLVVLEPSTKYVFSEVLSAELGVPRQIQRLIEQCMSDNPIERPTLQQVIEVLHEAPTTRALESAPDETVVSSKELHEMVNGIMDYIRASADLSRRDRLFPADPMVFFTNPLSLAYGAAGVAYALARIEGEIPKQLRTWILERPVSPEDYPPGLYVGSSGIAWAFWASGMQEVALQTLRAANRHPLLWEAADLFYGASGYGLACLHFFLVTREQEWLNRAAEVGEWLLRTKRVNEVGDYYWPDKQADIWSGYSQGASGIALFLLYLSIVAGEQQFLEAGKRALSFDMRHLETTDEGLLSVPRGVVGESGLVLMPYWLDGSAGVITVLVRFWAYTRDEEYRDILDLLAPDVMRKYTVFPGLFRGLSGLGNALLDLADFTGEERYLQATSRVASGVLLHRVQRPAGIAFPGEQSLRISTDFGTGSAGIALFLDRLARQNQRPGNFNFTLDLLLADKIMLRKENDPARERDSS